MDPELLQQLLDSDDPADIALAEEYLKSPFLQFQPRPDRPELGDEMTSFLTSDRRGKVVLGGTGSNKTYTTAWYLAHQIMTMPPPEKNVPIWIIAPKLDTAGQIWTQALSKFITPDMIQDNGIRWQKSNLYPDVVMLKPDAYGNNYNIFLYSSDMKREALQGATVHTVWLDEQAPAAIIEECWGRLRKWGHPGQFLLTCTPLEPDPWLQDLWDRRDEPAIAALYGFYRFNTACSPHVDRVWLENWLASLSPDQRMTRQFGDFANFRGSVFPEFTSDLILRPPYPDTERGEQYIGVDFGFRHPAALWLSRVDGIWYITRERQLQNAMPEELAETIKTRYDYRHKVFVDSADAISKRKLEQAGIHTSPCRDKNLTASILLCKNLFHQGKIKVFDCCMQTIRQLRAYRWKDFDENAPKPKTEPTAEQSNVLREVVKARDHLVDAFRYVIYSADKSKVLPWRQPPSSPIRLLPQAGVPKLLRVGGMIPGFFHGGGPIAHNSPRFSTKPPF